MNTPTIEDYRSALRAVTLTDHQLELLRFQYDSPDRTSTSSLFAQAMGYKESGATNLNYGGLARKIGEQLEWSLPEKDYVSNYLSTFEKPDEHYRWTMRIELARALELEGLVDPSRAVSLPEEVDPDEEYVEGAVKQITVNAYERNDAARAACLKEFGYTCAVCEVKLSDIYGPIADQFIQVHHLRSITTHDGEHPVDPIEDLRPVCPNCHAIIHRRRPDHHDIGEVREMIAEQKGESTQLS